MRSGGRTDGALGVYVHQPAHGQRGAARYARRARQIGHGKRDDYVDDARPQSGHEREREHQRREGAKAVHDTHYHSVRLAVVARYHPYGGAYGYGYGDHCRADEQRQPRARERLAIDVAAQVVRTEEVGERRGLQPVCGIEPRGLVRGEHVGEDGQQRQHDKNRRAVAHIGASPYALEVAPDTLLERPS